jgi:hypothetical protein
MFSQKSHPQRCDSCYDHEHIAEAIADNEEAVQRPSPKVWIWSPDMDKATFYAMNPKADGWHWKELICTPGKRVERPLYICLS